MSQEYKVSTGSSADKIVIVTTCTNAKCTTTTTEEYDKYYYINQLNREKSSNTSTISRLTARNTEIDNLISKIQALV